MRTRFCGVIYCILILSIFSGFGHADSSGVTPTKQLLQIDKNEIKLMCNSYRKDAREIKKGNCTLDGLVKAKDPDECLEISKSCLKRIEESSDSKECAGINVAGFAGCTVTIGEIEKCFSQLVDYAKSLDCSQFGQKLHEPPTCMDELRMKCGSTTELISK